MTQKFNFGRGGTTPRDKLIDYEFIEKGKDKNQVYISILIKNFNFISFRLCFTKHTGVLTDFCKK